MKRISSKQIAMSIMQQIWDGKNIWKKNKHKLSDREVCDQVGKVFRKVRTGN